MPFFTVRGLVAIPAAAGGTFAFISGVETAGDINGVTSGAINTTGAGLLVAVAVSYNDQPVPTLTDSKSNIWTGLTTQTNAGGPRCRIWYSVPSSVGSGHTVSLDGTGNFPMVGFAAFSGGAASPFDTETGATGSSANPSAGSGITPSANNALVIVGTGIGAGSVSSINGGFTIVDSAIAHSGGHNFGGAMAYLIQTSSAAADPDWTLSGSTDWAAAIASFKAS